MSKSLRIGIVCYPTPGGSGVVATELGRSLAARGHEIHFITNGRPSRLAEFEKNIYLHKVETGQYPVFQNYTPYSLSLAVKIREVAQCHGLDLVHAHYAIPHATSAFLAKEMSKPEQLKTMTTLHGTDITLVGVMPSFYEVTRFSINVSDAVTTVSQFLRDETVREFKTDRDIDVIHNFVDIDEFQPREDDALRERFAPDGEAILMHVSNFRKVKNIPVIIRVFARIRKKMKARLVLIGDGPESSSAEQLARELGVYKDVVFLGDQEYIARLLPVADVFMLPSEHESFGLAALEAMSCGIPVVGSRIGGLPEVIEDHKTGYLCSPQDEACMADIVSNLLEDETGRAQMGAAARQRVVDNFNKDVIVEQYLNAYQRLVDGE